MTTLGERPFHWLMGALFLGSTFLDPAMRAVTAAWSPPQISLMTLVVGLIWVGLFAGYRGKNLEDRMRVLEDRLQRSEQKVKILDAEMAERKRPLI